MKINTPHQYRTQTLIHVLQFYLERNIHLVTSKRLRIQISTNPVKQINKITVKKLQKKHWPIYFEK